MNSCSTEKNSNIEFSIPSYIETRDYAAFRHVIRDNPDSFFCFSDNIDEGIFGLIKVLKALFYMKSVIAPLQKQEKAISYMSLLLPGGALAIASDHNPHSAPMGDLLTQAAILGAFERLSKNGW